MVEDKAASTEKMYRYCIVCEKVFGPYLKSHCTSSSLVAMNITGLLKKTRRFYTIEGQPLSEAELDQKKAIEQAAFEEQEGKKGTRVDAYAPRGVESQDQSKPEPPEQAAAANASWLKVILFGSLAGFVLGLISLTNRLFTSVSMHIILRIIAALAFAWIAGSLLLYIGKMTGEVVKKIAAYLCTVVITVLVTYLSIILIPLK
jgi:heme/copper-type cytochrome/quinol oxidase subunit 4